jgi:hypothetical protein
MISNAVAGTKANYATRMSIQSPIATHLHTPPPNMFTMNAALHLGSSATPPKARGVIAHLRSGQTQGVGGEAAPSSSHGAHGTKHSQLHTIKGAWGHT